MKKENILHRGSYWAVNTRGIIVECPKSSKHYAMRKDFGNCFTNRKKAEIARERMKRLFERIKSL